MDIGQAKQQIRESIMIYLQKDALGQYRIPRRHQRPIFLQGPPGLGKTAIMEQLSKELGIGLVSYSMTHHTRQSAIGLPMIVERNYGGKQFSVSEYTMSEILASVYDCMEKTGVKEGILFLDEINCISETLLPSMLLFLQYKIFGGNVLPEGWIVVTAGNQPKYNKSVRDFDAAIRDRMQFIEVEPEYSIWRTYAKQQGVSDAIISYLNFKKEHFYLVDTSVQGYSIVTPRGWEDLSQNIRMREELKLPVDERVTSQYLQNMTVAREFAAYYEIYRQRKASFDVTLVLERRYDREFVEQIKERSLDDRIWMVSFLVEALTAHMAVCMADFGGMKQIRDMLRDGGEFDNTLFGTTQSGKEAHPSDIVLHRMKRHLEKNAASLEPDSTSELLAAARLVDELNRMAALSTVPEKDLRARYQKRLECLREQVSSVQKQIANLFEFLKEAFGNGSELSMAAHDLTDKPAAAVFLAQFPSMEYVNASEVLLLHHKEDKLLQQINLDLTL